MEPADRLHALDAVRAIALLLGLVLHATAAFLQDFPIPMWKDQSSEVAAVIYYTIHIFRMSAFFLIAGFFGRLVVERRGFIAFVKDRGKRIAIPLFLFGPVVVISIAMAFGLGAVTHGMGYLLSASQEAQNADPGAAAGTDGGGGGINTAHLWFLYYLLIFYAMALALRTLLGLIDARGTVGSACDRLIGLVMSGLWAPAVIAVPLIAYHMQFATWNEWLGLPAPQLLMPDVPALVGYGLAFGLGWLLNRQVQRVLNLQYMWHVYLVIALLLTAFCLYTIGTTPRWQGPNLSGTDRLDYTVAYFIAMWCWIFALIGAAVRYLSHGHPKLRYLADASYWIYLMHMTTIIFFVALLKPYPLPWFVKFVVTVGGSLLLLLPTYHYWVRFTWVGAILNGRRQSLPVKTAVQKSP